MAQQLTLGIMITIELEQKPLGWELFLESEESVRPGGQDPSIATSEVNHPGMNAAVDDHSSGEYRDAGDATLPLHSQLHERVSHTALWKIHRYPRDHRLSYPVCRRPLLHPACILSTGLNGTSVQRPSVLTRLDLSINTASTCTNVSRKPIVLPTDFQTRPEEPEMHCVDAIGMILPGVCDRRQCAYPRAHFVSTFRLCEPIEYTTTLADHGITYTDYSRLVTALANFVDDIIYESKQKKYFFDSDYKQAATGAKEVGATNVSVPKKNKFFDATEQLHKAQQHAAALNKLLEDITWNLQARGVPVMICVNSFSLFAPHRISEAHIQVLHVTLEQMLQAALAHDAPSEAAKADSGMEERLSFIDLAALVGFEERPPRPKLECQAVSATKVAPRRKDSRYQRQKACSRDRSKPAPLWPNAIPSGKR